MSEAEVIDFRLAKSRRAARELDRMMPPLTVEQHMRRDLILHAKEGAPRDPSSSGT
jgi:hypothetical protein